jgi:uroporphyrinogen-III synthase
VGLPLIELVDNQQALQLYSFAMQDFPPHSIVIFVSPTAADLAKISMPNWRSDLRYVAVGESSAACLPEYIKVIVPESQTSEGLLDLPLLQDLSAKQVMIVKGNRGRELLEQQLKQRGAQVSLAELYRRKYNTNVEKGEWQLDEIHCIIATSGDLLNAAFRFFSSEDIKGKHWIVVSDRLAELADSLGIVQCSVSDGANDAALLQCAKRIVSA